MTCKSNVVILTIFISIFYFKLWGANVNALDVRCRNRSVITIEDKEISLYPNPTTGIVYIKLDNAFDAVVYNYQGQVVKREYDNEGQLDLSNLSTGVYFVEIRDGQNVMIEKVIVK